MKLLNKLIASLSRLPVFGKDDKPDTGRTTLRAETKPGKPVEQKGKARKKRRRRNKIAKASRKRNR